VASPTSVSVSVVITCHNLGAYLEEAVDSVLAQTWQDFEILVVDDGSTDAQTQALLAGFRRPATRVVRLPHGGLAAARNAGIAETSGRYLCALDADDRLAPSFLEKTVRVLDADPSVSFVSAWLRTFGDEEWDWTPERCDLPALLCEDTVLTAAVVRREAVAAVGGYDTAMPVQGDEDWDLWLTLVERGHRGVILPEILFEYRRRAGSMSSSCWYGPGHLPLAGYRIRKHREAYRRHLFDVLRHQDAETAAVLQRNDALEREIASRLEPAVALRGEELAALRRRLAALDASRARPAIAVTGEPRSDRIRDLEEALTATAAEVTALRASMSWRLTAPLRGAYGWLLTWRGRQ
jgi:glycosyltransferase involved in cell wall biosynthesis